MLAGECCWFDDEDARVLRCDGVGAIAPELRRSAVGEICRNIVTSTPDTTTDAEILKSCNDEGLQNVENIAENISKSALSFH